MILEETLAGRVSNGIGWSSCIVEGGAAGDNWRRFVEAFRFQFPDIAAYAHGTFNVNLEGEWLPPDDVSHRLGAHQRGIELRQDWRIGADLLFNGNYIHPTIEVVAINGLSIEGGRLYFRRLRGKWRILVQDGGSK